jgi:bifunctional UDP-N-acetylglucosamine pyrophosphorylase/glucosamine-1-phosphate N-acetyltransferase
MSRPVVAIILAAGRGTRMKSQLPKVLHKVCGRTMISHVIDAVVASGVSDTIVVTGHGGELVEAEVEGRARTVVQREQLGTAHAVRMAAPLLAGLEGDVLVCCGDTPLLRAGALAAIVERRREHHSGAIVLTTELDNPKGYGRIVRARDGGIAKIVEQKDANAYEDQIREINTGVYCFDARLMLDALERVGNQNSQGEYYLPDVVQILAADGHEVEALLTEDRSAVIGVNSRADLAVAEGHMRRRVLEELMAAGVSIIDPTCTYVGTEAAIGPETTLHPGTVIEGRTVVGEGAHIGPQTRLCDAVVGDGARITESVVENATIGAGAVIGPFSRIREGAEVPDGSEVGSFVELVGDEETRRGARVVLPAATLTLPEGTRPANAPVARQEPGLSAAGRGPVRPRRVGGQEAGSAAPAKNRPASVAGLFPSGWKPDPGMIPPDVRRQLAEIAALRDDRLTRREAEIARDRADRAKAAQRDGAEAVAPEVAEPDPFEDLSVVAGAQSWQDAFEVTNQLRDADTTRALAEDASAGMPNTSRAQWREARDAVSPREMAQAARFADSRWITLQRDNPELLGLERIVDTLLEGGVVALPGDTSFVMMADATNRRAIDRLRAAAGRADNDPAVIAVHSERMLRSMVRRVPEAATRLIREFWPGPLTLIFDRPAALLEHASPRDTIAVRQPDHTPTLSVISLLERPVAMATLDDLPDHDTAEQLAEHLGDTIDLVVAFDNEPSPRARKAGSQSTVVDLTAAAPRLARRGALGIDQLREVIADLLVDADSEGGDAR